MNMHVDTESRRAFELVTEALLEIDKYKLQKDRRPLHQATHKLDEALEEDPQYLRAHYVRALADDLVGHPSQAAERLERVLSAAPPFKDEVEYNLGVAHYHQYHKKNLGEAIKHFEAVVKTTEDDTLRLLARAGMAQAYAVMMVPRLPEEAVLDEIKQDYELSERHRKSVAMALMSRAEIDPIARSEIEWTMHNARAIALMFYSDYFGSPGEKIRDLGEALSELGQAEKYSARNFALYCNVASVHMRLGYWREKSGSKRSDASWDFEQALKRLQAVIEDIRPNYGFALYEMGRTYRLTGDFSRALEYLAKVKAMPDDGDRNISDHKINHEIRLANERKTDFPGRVDSP